MPSYTTLQDSTALRRTRSAVPPKGDAPRPETKTLRRDDNSDSLSWIGADPDSFTGSIWADGKSGEVQNRPVGFVDGVADAGTGLVTGIKSLIEPGGLSKALDNLVDLPSNLHLLWQHRDEFLRDFENMPASEQARVLGRLTGEIELLVAPGLGAGKAGGVNGLNAGRELAGGVVAMNGGQGVLDGAGTLTIDLGKFAGPTAAGVATLSVAQQAGEGGSAAKTHLTERSPARPTTTTDTMPKDSGALGGATDEELDAAVENMRPAGDPIKLGPHGAATRNRKASGVSGQQVQSAHLLPQSVGRNAIANYNPDLALTRLMDKAVHRGMDAPWKTRFVQIVGSGRMTGTAQEVFDIVSSAIQVAPDIAPAEKNSLMARLSDEMFMESDLKPDTVIKLPYSK